MLFPKKVKHRKWQRLRGKFRGRATSGTTLAFGSSGLKSVGKPTLISAEQIEAARRVMTRYTRKGGKLWIRIFPDRPITKRPPEVTMGGGKGDLAGYAALVKPGQMLFELEGIPIDAAHKALYVAGTKLPIKIKIVDRA
ncbi:MAG: 50S ribosomal protein L16 [Parcubacteria group bacterium]|nr:50S ribosomal protein L16 [Parcubacteria group bacterium]